MSLPHKFRLSFDGLQYVCVIRQVNNTAGRKLQEARVFQGAGKVVGLS